MSSLLGPCTVLTVDQCHSVLAQVRPVPADGFRPELGELCEGSITHTGTGTDCPARWADWFLQWHGDQGQHEHDSQPCLHHSNRLFVLPLIFTVIR